MNKQQFQIGLATVALLVALRLGLGCHFLYEGVWKIRHHDEFTAEPFLTQAKGPLSGVFYAMLDDIDGRRRLQKDLVVVKAQPGDKTVAVTDPDLWMHWDRLCKRFVDANPSAGKDQAEKVLKAHSEALEK